MQEKGISGGVVKVKVRIEEIYLSRESTFQDGQVKKREFTSLSGKPIEEVTFEIEFPLKLEEPAIQLEAEVERLPDELLEDTEEIEAEIVAPGLHDEPVIAGEQLQEAPEDLLDL